MNDKYFCLILFDCFYFDVIFILEVIYEINVIDLKLNNFISFIFLYILYILFFCLILIVCI